MPRKARIDAPGALHHIIVRGIERRKIFYDDNDRDNFLDRLGMILTETQTSCFAWGEYWGRPLDYWLTIAYDLPIEILCQEKPVLTLLAPYII